MTVRWLKRNVVEGFHAEQLVQHGGGAGLRDEGLLESALARPEQKAAYGEPDLFELAAAYLFGIVTNHPFIDGNKRTGFLAAYTFLMANGWELDAPEAEAYALVMGVAAGEIGEDGAAMWLRDRSVPIASSS